MSTDRPSFQTRGPPQLEYQDEQRHARPRPDESFDPRICDGKKSSETKHCLREQKRTREDGEEAAVNENVPSLREINEELKRKQRPIFQTRGQSQLENQDGKTPSESNYTTSTSNTTNTTSTDNQLHDLQADVRPRVDCFTLIYLLVVPPG